MKQKRELFACGLWVAAVAFMTFGTMDAARDGHTTSVLAWGIFLGLAALVPTFWCIVERLCLVEDDVTVEQIASVVDALHDAKKDVAHLISPRS